MVKYNKRYNSIFSVHKPKARKGYTENKAFIPNLHYEYNNNYNKKKSK